MSRSDSSHSARPPSGRGCVGASPRSSPKLAWRVSGLSSFVAWSSRISVSAATSVGLRAFGTTKYPWEPAGQRATSPSATRARHPAAKVEPRSAGTEIVTQAAEDSGQWGDAAPGDRTRTSAGRSLPATRSVNHTPRCHAASRETINSDTRRLLYIYIYIYIYVEVPITKYVRIYVICCSG